MDRSSRINKKKWKWLQEEENQDKKGWIICIETMSGNADEQRDVQRKERGRTEMKELEKNMSYILQ